METKIHRYPLMILESHLDTFGHVNNASYLQLFEQARWEIITANGYGLDKVHETNLGPVILELKVRFNRELKLRQKVIIESQVEMQKRKFAIIRQTIRDDTEGAKIYCTAEFLFGLFDLRERKLVSPTQEWLKALGVC